MDLINENTLKKALINFRNYLDTVNGKTTVKSIALKLKEYIVEDSDAIVDKRFEALNYKMEDGCVLVILKNKRNLFDMYLFNKKISLSGSNLTSSEALEDTLRSNPQSGYVIDDISADDILIFLKAYYLYCSIPKEDKMAQNISRKYDAKSYEMVMIEDMEKLEEQSFQYTILYPQEVLPYSLEYLNDYKLNLFAKNVTGILFSEVLRSVRANRFIGLKLNKIR